MTRSFQAAVLVAFCSGCSVQQPAMPYDAQRARSNIVATLPAGWSISPPAEGSRFGTGQEGFTQSYFSHSNAEAFMLLGPEPNYIIWRDREGHEHRQDLARECLYIWLVPGDFEPPFPRFPSEPWGGETLFSSKSIGAYGFATHEITNRARFEAIMEEATRSGWGEVRISWRSWKRDIADSLKK